MRDATTAHQHGERKALRREKAKKIALGHKEDDYEEEQKWEQSMRIFSFSERKIWERG